MIDIHSSRAVKLNQYFSQILACFSQDRYFLVVWYNICEVLWDHFTFYLARQWHQLLLNSIKKRRMGNNLNSSQKEIDAANVKSIEQCQPMGFVDSNAPDQNPLHVYVHYRTSLPIQTLSSLKKGVPSRKQQNTCPINSTTPLFTNTLKQKARVDQQLLPSNTIFRKKKKNENAKQNMRSRQIPPEIEQKPIILSSKQRLSTPENLFKQNKFSVQQFLQIKKQPIQNYYAIKEKIGEGSFGQVFRAICLRTQEEKAIKVLKTKYMKEHHKSEFLSELTLLSKIHHPSIISLYDVFQYNGNYYVVMEYCKGGSIVDMISKTKRKSEAIIVNIMKQLLSALSYLHSINIIHRDIKLENIVFLNNIAEESEEFIPIKIIDFGSAVQTKFKIIQNYPIAGTMPYLGPQALKGLLTEKSDIWSSGVLMIILLTGVSPFKGKTECDTKLNVTSMNLEFDEGYLNNLSMDAKDLLKGMLQRTIHKRLSAQQASQHHWFHQSSEQQKQISLGNIQMLQKYYRSNNLISALECFLAARNISQQQRQKLAEIFNEIDKDQNGVITVPELIQVFDKQVGGHSEQQVKGIVSTIDANQSGQIDFNEFIVAMEGRSKLFVRSALEQAFDYFDKGNTGYLELKEILKGSNKDEIEYYLNQIDTDHDHKISREEFVDYLTKYEQ